MQYIKIIIVKVGFVKENFHKKSFGPNKSECNFAKEKGEYIYKEIYGLLLLSILHIRELTQNTENRLNKIRFSFPSSTNYKTHALYSLFHYATFFTIIQRPKILFVKTTSL